MALKLHDVTLVAVETFDHELMRLAIEDSVSKVEFAEVLIFTDRPLEFASLTKACDPRIITVDNWPDKLGWCRFNWYGVPPHVRSSHILFQQWDAGVIDTAMWRHDFFDYDYIGAVWDWHPVKKVGNSGFSLKSTRLARYVREHRDVFQCDSPLEDDLLCRKYRPQLEDKGFLWAPESVARDFAYEGAGEGAKPPGRHFGFHATYNFNLALDHVQLLERGRLMLASSYIRESYMMQGFAMRNPGVMEELLRERELRAAE